MMIKKLIIISSFLLFCGVNAQATHTVAKGDTPYNIAKKYGMTVDELGNLNPSVKSGVIKIGDVLKVSAKAATDTSASGVGYIVLQPKQTIYGITKQYHISEADLRKLNPDLDSNMRIGDRVALPQDLINKYGAGQEIASAPSEPMVSENPAPVERSLAAGEYEVQPRDNYYRITRKFDITQKELFVLNPGLEEKGLKAGDVIRVKGDVKDAVFMQTSKGINEEVTTPVAPTSTVADGDYETYTVKSGDTVFGILNKFGISLDQLLELNPGLTNGLKAGMVLKIRKLDQTYVKKSGDALNVVLMLPFGFDTNDTKYRSLSADFLTGAKLAVERNTKKGQKLNIKVVDAGNENSFKNSLSQISRENTDLIIGPFFKSNVVEVLNYVNKEKIPVVAPFANAEDLYGYSNLIIVETNNDVYVDRIIKEVGDAYSNQKIYIVADANRSNANRIKAGLEKNLKNTDINIITSPLDIQVDKNMMTGQAAPVIAILASDNESTGAQFSNRLIEISQEVQGVKAFSMFYHSDFEKNIDALSQANLVYLMDRKINTEGSFEKEVLADYRSKYCKSPSKFAVVGFDVVNDILTRENKSGEVFKQINKVQTQLATKFEYVRAKRNGAYINTGYRVVRLVP